MTKKQLNEDATKKIYLVTTTNGEEYVATLTDMERDKIKQAGGTVEDPGTGVDGVSSATISEDDTVTETNYTMGDILNLGKQFNLVVQEVLRAHGDQVAYTVPKYNKATKDITIYVHYRNDPDKPGEASQDGFKFRVAGDTVKFVNGAEENDVCPIDKKSGTAVVNEELVKDFLTKFIGNSGSGEKEIQEPDREDDGLEEDQHLKEFTEALNAYKTNKNKESLKELFRSSRGFEGDSIQDKFKNAAKQYLMGQKEEKSKEPLGNVEITDVKPDGEAVAVVGQAGEIAKDTSLTLGYALFIRLMEFAKENAKQDVDLHFIAEHVGQCDREKGCATMEDYDMIVTIPEQEVDDPDKPKEETTGHQEDVDAVMKKTEDDGMDECSLAESKKK